MSRMMSSKDRKRNEQKKIAINDGNQTDNEDPDYPVAGTNTISII
jgi:hypothetical protein